MGRGEPLTPRSPPRPERVAGVLISAGRLLDGLGGPVRAPGAVLVRDGRIAEVFGGVPPPEAVPPDVERVALPDCTLLPGLIDAHVHLCLPGDGTPFPEAVAEPRGVVQAIALRNAQTALRAGITTLRDCGGFPDVLFALRRAISRGYAQGPRLVLAGWPLTITGGHCHYFGGEADGVEGVRAKVRETIKLGADYIKAMGSGGGTPGTQPWRASYDAAEVRALVDEAHRFGLRATLHCLCAEAIDHAVAAGADEIQHAWFLTGPDTPQQLDPVVADRLAAAGIPICPTLSVSRHLLRAVAAAPGGADAATTARWRRTEAETLRITAELRRRGVPLVAGSDAGWRYSPFDALLDDLELMARAGMPPAECLVAATSAAARALALDGETGAIRPALAADLLAVAGRPDDDLAALRSVRFVMLAGRRIV